MKAWSLSTDWQCADGDYEDTPCEEMVSNDAQDLENYNNDLPVKNKDMQWLADGLFEQINNLRA